MILRAQVGRLTLEGGAVGFLAVQIPLHGLSVLSIERRHVEDVARLPLHHRDPFDRLLVAQARTEKMPLITGDREMKSYDVAVLW